MPENLQESKQVEIVDQLLLPHSVQYESVGSVQEAWQAIRSMKIRGAPAIASLAALGIACELLRLPQGASTTELQKLVLDHADYLLTSRPTAVNLREAMDRIRKAAEQRSNLGPADFASQLVDICKNVWSDDVERNYTMGDLGAQWLLNYSQKQGSLPESNKITVLTVCNTGSLATSAYGTALGMITSLHQMGRLEHAYFAQTTPYSQGARLTSLELQSLNIPCTMVPDTAIAALISGKAGRKIHGFIAGADRIAANGDTANKISTFQISTLCKSIPQAHPPAVVVCAPLTTLDLTMDDGSSIVIEERPEIEACTATGKLYHKDPQKDEQEAGAPVTVLVTPAGTKAWNPAFDVTPARLIDAVVTEAGVAPKSSADTFDLRDFVAKAK